MLFSAGQVDEYRKRKALSAELTPVSIDEKAQTAKFAGSEGDVYNTSLDTCTCVDFTMNLGGYSPCKHMIRLAMELGLYPDDGIVRDQKAAYERYYVGVLREFIRNAPCNKAVKVGKILDSANDKTINLEDDALTFAGVPSLVESGLFTVGKKQRIIPDKQGKKELEGLRRTLLIRLGKMIYDNLSYEPIMTLVDNISKFEEDVEK